MLASLLLFTAGLVAAVPLESRQTSTDPNAPCGQQPFGYGPPSSTDTNFMQNQIYPFMSLVAQTPAGYTAAFRNQSGATSQAGYQGYYYLMSYNTTQCASLCSSSTGCTAFNIYYERDPLQNPANACPNPNPTTSIKCSLWSSTVSQGTATNYGQYRDQFHVVIAGSDGFNHN